MHPAVTKRRIEVRGRPSALTDGPRRFSAETVNDVRSRNSYARNLVPGELGHKFSTFVLAGEEHQRGALEACVMVKFIDVIPGPPMPATVKRVIDL